MRDVMTALLQRAAETPQDVFCWFRARGRETAFTCADALASSARYANLFRAAGLGSGDIVAIVLRHSPDLYFSFLGAMLAGCTPSFLAFPSSRQDPQLYWSHHRALFERIGAAAVLTDADNLQALAEHCPGPRAFTPADAEGQPRAFEGRRPAPEEVAFLQHSSGTTGLKKGVMLSFGAVAAQVERYAEELRLGSDDVIVSWLPLYHDMGLIACFMLPLTAGVPIVSLDAFEWVAQPQSLFEAIAQRRGTHCWLPNFAFHHLLRTVAPGFEADLSGMRAFIDCSEPCRVETLQQFAAGFARLGVRLEQCRICYAMAETVFAVTQTPAGEPVAALQVDEAALADGRAEPPGRGAKSRSVASVGRALRDVAIRVVDADGRPLPDGRVGEVAIQAPFLFSGYHKDPETTARKMRGGWYHTSDLGFLDGGELYLLGRTDDLVILNGRNVFAHHVEFAINAEVPQVKAGRCIALGVFSEEVGSQELVILAELDSQDPAAGKLLGRSIKTTVLNGFGVMPKEVKVVPPGWLAKTTSGKIARDLNLRKYLESKRAVEAAAQ
jgi:acyl-CoA synthetase (AMP-forming)/AMP-acid ligase II